MVLTCPVARLHRLYGGGLLDKALTNLYGFEYDTKDKTVGSKLSRMKATAQKALGIVAEGRMKDDADKLSIYQWHVVKVGKMVANTQGHRNRWFFVCKKGQGIKKALR